VVLFSNSNRFTVVGLEKSGMGHCRKFYFLRLTIKISCPTIKTGRSVCYEEETKQNKDYCHRF
jgi:hypothetical protein